MMAMAAMKMTVVDMVTGCHDGNENLDVCRDGDVCVSHGDDVCAFCVDDSIYDDGSTYDGDIFVFLDAYNSNDNNQLLVVGRKLFRVKAFM